MKNAKAVFALIGTCLILLLGGCGEGLPLCDDERVRALVVQVANEVIENGLKPSEQDTLRSIMTTTANSFADVTAQGQSRVRTCSTKLLFSFSDPVQKQILEHVEKGEKLVDAWVKKEKTEIEARRIMGYASRYSPLWSQSEVELQAINEKGELTAQAGELRYQIKALRRSWSSTSKAIEVITNVSVANRADKAGFQVSLSHTAFLEAKQTIPLILRFNGMTSKVDAKPDKSSTQTRFTHDDVSLQKDMDYNYARRVLIQEGWLPVENKNPAGLFAVAKAIFADGNEELAACADSVPVSCRFLWAHQQSHQELVVQTLGQRPKIESWTVR